MDLTLSLGPTPLLQEFVESLITKAERRAPDFVIGPSDNPYLKRWYLKRDRQQGNIYLHQVLRDDDDRALHDHPWDSQSVVLKGVLREVMADSSRVLYAGDNASRAAEVAHRLEVVEGPVWTLFITGPWRREWGFHLSLIHI